MNAASPRFFEHLHNKSRKASLIRLREAVAQILANNLLPHFTDHSVQHSDHLTLVIDRLIAPLQAGSNPLSEKELMILYGACYCHDVGMQYENAGTTRTIAALNLSQPWEDLSEETRRCLLRDHHHRISAEMVTMSVRSATPILGIQLTSEYEPDRLAALCEAHYVDVTLERYAELTQSSAGVRMDLLSGLLRVADILDEHRRRAARNKAQTLLLDPASQTHWWRNYYTEEVRIDPGENSVSLWFDFPRKHHQEYSRIVPQLQVPLIQDEFARHQSVFSRFGLSWYVTYKIDVKPYNTTEAMPDEVLVEMVKELNRRRKEEAEERRQFALQEFVAARPYVLRRLTELNEKKEELESAEYLRQLRQIVEDLWEIGGKRSAWIRFKSGFERHNGALMPKERLKMGIALASMMMQDKASERAVRLLKELEGLTEHIPGEEELKLAFFKTYATCLVGTYKYEEGLVAIRRAMDLSPDEEARRIIRVQLTEAQLLMGNLDEALMTIN